MILESKIQMSADLSKMAFHFKENTIQLNNLKLGVQGDVAMPDRVVIELGGALCWRAHSGALVGLTLRRPRACTEATSALMIKNGFVACHRIVVDNLGSGGAAIVVHSGPFPRLECASKRKYGRTSK